jgi:glycosyltransferase involved in cell wall biosynthesis
MFARACGLGAVDLGGAMRVTLVICTRNRAARLRETLDILAKGDLAAEGADLVLVDSASSDETPDVIANFAKRAPFSVTPCRADRPGLSRARNEGIRHVQGDLVAFSDDDCLVDPDYFRALKSSFDPREAQYGGGETYLASKRKGGPSPNVSNRTIIQPTVLLPPGAIHGANMFALRSVFAKVGGFNEDMGAGTPFPCEDIEFATRCSVAGFTGVFLPNVRVCHVHGRPDGSEEAKDNLRGYDHGRGAYYASLLGQGINQAWNLWSHCTPKAAPLPRSALEQLANEMEACAKYLRLMAERE